MSSLVLALFFLLWSGCGSSESVELGAEETEEVVETDRVLMFTLNTQEFIRTEESIATVNRIIDLHEEYNVPIDIFLTDTMVAVYEEDAPDLLERLKTSDVVAVSYHIRPPKPYYFSYDFLDLESLDSDAVYKLVKNYEEHVVDLETGEPTDQPGGYEYLKAILGYAPRMVAAQTSPLLKGSVLRVFREMGAFFTVLHGAEYGLNDQVEGLYVRPEQVEIKLFEYTGEEDVFTYLETQFAAYETEYRASLEAGGEPVFMNIKMHDNDFIADQSAWTAIYQHRGNKGVEPPYDLSVYDDRVEALSEAEQTAMWALYEQAVQYADDHREAYDLLNAFSLEYEYYFVLD